MLVDVADAETAGNTRTIPDELTDVPEIPVESVDRHRHLTLIPGSDEYGRMKHFLGNQDQPLGYALDDPVTEKPELGTTEIWRLANNTAMSYPMYLHLVHFQV